MLFLFILPTRVSPNQHQHIRDFMGGFQTENKWLAAMTTSTPPQAENPVSSATPPPPSYSAQLPITPKAEVKPQCLCHHHLRNLIATIKALVARHDARASSIDNDRSVEPGLRLALSFRLILVVGVKWIAFASCVSESNYSATCHCHGECALAQGAVEDLIETIGSRPAPRNDLTARECMNWEWNERVRANALLLQGFT